MKGHIFASVLLKPALGSKLTDFLAESFYDVKHGSSIIASNVRQINLRNENMENKHWRISFYLVRILIYLHVHKTCCDRYFCCFRINDELTLEGVCPVLCRHTLLFKNIIRLWFLECPFNGNPGKTLP